MSEMTIPHELEATNKKFCVAFAQVKMLTRTMEAIQKRYDRATRSATHHHCTQLRLRLSVLEGVRAMFFQYAHIQAQSVDDLQQILVEQRQKREQLRQTQRAQRRRQRNAIRQQMHLLTLDKNEAHPTEEDDTSDMEQTNSM